MSLTLELVVEPLTLKLVIESLTMELVVESLTLKLGCVPDSGARLSP